MPKEIPSLDEAFFQNMPSMSFQEIAFQVAKSLLEGELEDNILKQIVEESINFDAPLVELEENIYTLELFHGPTLAFKDFGARFMARLVSHFIKGSDRELIILVATSGDTGSAVAHGFLNVPGVRVVLLYPSGKVSEIQEKQLTTMGGNITALEVDGSFDDCQKLVKQAFVDEELKQELQLSSANSINIARLIPQSFYYFYAYARLKAKELPIVFSVPSGNYGNMTAGLMAKKMGLPVSRFLASTNVNAIVPQFLETGVFSPQASKKTISNAMDVGNPSNFVRIEELYHHDLDSIRADIWGHSFTDEETKRAIKEVYQKNHYLLDPHGAVAYLGLKAYLKSRQGGAKPVTGIFLETAHPAKFMDVVEPIIGEKIEIPERLQVFLRREKKATFLPNQFRDLKTFLLNL